MNVSSEFSKYIGHLHNFIIVGQISFISSDVNGASRLTSWKEQDQNLAQVSCVLSCLTPLLTASLHQNLLCDSNLG